MPYFVDIYNDKLKNLTFYHPAFREAKNRYIDTNQILDPVWDTPEDFNHYSEKVGRPEAIYLLNKMFGSDESAKLITKIGNTSSFPSGKAYHNLPVRDNSVKHNNDVYRYLMSQQIFMGALVWFIMVCFLPLLQRTRSHVQQRRSSGA